MFDGVAADVDFGEAEEAVAVAAREDALAEVDVHPCVAIDEMAGICPAGLELDEDGMALGRLKQRVGQHRPCGARRGGRRRDLGERRGGRAMERETGWARGWWGVRVRKQRVRTSHMVECKASIRAFERIMHSSRARENQGTVFEVLMSTIGIKMEPDRFRAEMDSFDRFPQIYHVSHKQTHEDVHTEKGQGMNRMEKHLMLATDRFFEICVPHLNSSLVLPIRWGLNDELNIMMFLLGYIDDISTYKTIYRGKITPSVREDGTGTQF